MGRDKAWLTFEGRALIECVLVAARPVVDRLVIVIDPTTQHREQYQDLCRRFNAEAIDDLRPRNGPLGGIETALTNCAGEEAALVLACDLPFLTLPLLARLYAESTDHPGEIIVPIDGNGRLQPLVAVYPATCLGTIRDQLAAGLRRVDRLFDCFPTRHLLFSGISSLAGSERVFTNINTPADYDEVLSPPAP